MIKISAVNKSFSSMYAVRDLNVDIAKGEIFGLVGPNGAGKTTTLKMMTGLLMPDSGTIHIGQYNIATEPIKAKSIFGYVPDRAFLYEKLTTREFLVFIASVYGLKKSGALQKIGELLNLFGLEDIEDDLIEGFSQGMRQRLVFASALLHDPEVLLIDEPFTGLDPFGVKLLRGVISGLSSKGVSVFLATHSLHIAEDLCHRVGFIKKGSLIAVKERDEIRGFDGGLEGMFLELNV